MDALQREDKEKKKEEYKTVFRGVSKYPVSNELSISCVSVFPDTIMWVDGVLKCESESFVQWVRVEGERDVTF